MFGSKKIKELEGDIKTLYTLYESLERSIKTVDVFKSFTTYHYHSGVEQDMGEIELRQEREDISVRDVVSMILDKMRLWVKYIPAKKEVVKETSSEFTLRSVDKF